MGIEEHVAEICPRCDPVDVGTRHARLCQSRGVGKLARTACPRDVQHVEAARNSTPSEERRNVKRRPNLRMDIVVRRGDPRDAPNTAYREKFILLDVTHTDPNAQIYLQGGSADHDG